MKIQTTKYTILKVLLRNSNKGFTLLELIFGLMIMVIVGGLAMNALVQASSSFNQDKKSIDSSQNLSAILELIGNDVKQSGEQMNDSSFPVIKIEKIASGDLVDMPGSSKITIRRALTASMTLCEDITGVATKTTLVVTDTSKTTEANCQLGTTTTTTLPAASGSITKPPRLKEARDKRCQLDDVNGDYSSPTTTDYCRVTKDSPDKEKVLAAVSDKAGHLRTFEYTDDTAAVLTAVTPATSPPTNNTRYSINISGLSADTTNTYNVGSPIYLLEERVYKLDKDGNLKMKRYNTYGDDRDFETLIRGMKNFKISARVYGNKDTKETDAVSNTLATPVAPNLLPVARRCDSTIANYICEFNTTVVDDWKTLQGIKVELEARYDATGQNATATTAQTDKLKAAAEFFPRNVLSK
jgi:prepilin-type N-terminal cleavage/methylation domain-containing protein